MEVINIDVSTLSIEDPFLWKLFPYKDTNDKILAVVNNVILLLQLDEISCQVLCLFQGHRNVVSAIEEVDDTLWSCGTDGSVMVWECPQGAERQQCATTKPLKIIQEKDRELVSVHELTWEL